MRKSLVISLLTVLGATAGAGAQQVVGTWEYVPMFGSTPQRLVDTPNTVYSVSQNSLSGYDKQTQELITYSSANYLSDTGVNCLWYNPDRKYLVIAYTNGNIDLLYDSGKVVNIPDLLNAALTSVKTIMDVAFDGDRIYVATAFGLVTVNEPKAIVEESGLYNKTMYAVTVCDGYLYLSNGSMSYISPVSANHSLLSNFTEVSGGFRDFESIGNNTFFYGTGANELYAVTPAADHSKLTWTKLADGLGLTHASQDPVQRIQRTSNGVVVSSSAYNTTSRVVFADANGALISNTTLSGVLKQNVVGSWNASVNDIWAVSSTGIGEYDGTNPSTPLTTAIRPNAITGPNVGNIARTDDGTYYFMTQGVDNKNSYRDDVSLDMLEDNVFTALKPGINRGYEFCPLPNLGRGAYALGTYAYGVIIRDANGNLSTYDKTNSTLSNPTGAYMVADVHTDPDGNLWMYQNHQSKSGYSNLHILSADALKKGPELEDWIAVDLANGSALGTQHSISFVIHSSGIVVFSTNGGLIALNTNKDSAKSWINTAQYTISNKHTNSVDADGASFDPTYIFHMVEDQNGWIWCSTTQGVAVIKNPAELFSTSFAPVRPKVPRNDGTNLADYLLSGIQVCRIYVDANNEKWIATAGSGLYHVSADGTEILETFTTDNSDILSNTVYVAYPAPDSNDVYVGTDVGLQIYHSSSAPAATDYSSVKVYPNPVTPDYSGWITIDGLMDKSLVKISDASGKVFHTDTSSGGMILWDGCDASGNRVKSGVYFVHATQNESGSASGVVSKIVVVN